MVKRRLLASAAAILFTSFACADPPAVSGCSQARLIADLNKETAFESAEELLSLADCLGHEDPAIRDDFAYGTFVESLRNGSTRATALRPLTEKLAENLESAGADAKGFLAPFSVLVLAEVARVDRLKPFMTEPERSALVACGAEYLRSIDDYRGFTPAEGWRHGVAHAADLMMQLALNPRLKTTDAQAILAAIASQVVPGKLHFYIYSEPKRLARPILVLASTDLVSDEQWSDWFSALEANESNPRWERPYASVEGLARIHNTEAFASAVFIRASTSNDPALAIIAAAAKAVLQSIP